MKPTESGLRRGLQPMGSWLGVFVVALIIGVSSPALIFAEEQEAHEATGEQHEAAGEQHEGVEEHGEVHGEAHGEEHHFHKNHFGVFVGSTEGVEQHGEEHGDTGHGDGHGEVTSEGSSGGKDDPDFTIGLDYERRLTKLIGIGGMVDFVVEGRREYLLGPIGFLHPFKSSKFFAAPLAERVRETGDWEFVFRVGGLWEFHVGKFSVAPFTGSEGDVAALHCILGVAFGRGW